MGDLIDTTEMYLKTIYELEEDGVTPLRARIVRKYRFFSPGLSIVHILFRITCSFLSAFRTFSSIARGTPVIS